MKIPTSIILGMIGRRDLTTKAIVLFMYLLITVLSGCSSVISNSESFIGTFLAGLLIGAST